MLSYYDHIYPPYYIQEGFMKMCRADHKQNFYDNMKLVDTYHITNQFEYFNLFNQYDIDYKRFYDLKNEAKSTIYLQTLNKIISSHVCKLRLDMHRLCNSSFIKIIDKIDRGVQGTTASTELHTASYNEVELLPNIKVVLKEFSGRDNKYMAIHEGTMGVLLNSICYKTPNFMFFYGFIPCNSDIQTKQQCTSSSYPGYCLFEYIDGVSLKDWMIDIRDNREIVNDDDIISALAQIFLSIEIAAKELNFSHYDLHYQNIMIVKMKTPVIVSYQLNNNYINFYTYYLVKIIDYGYSVAKYNNIVYAINSGMEDYSICNVFSPQNDIIKITCFLEKYLFANEKIRKILKQILNDYIIGLDNIDNINEYIKNFTPFFNRMPENRRTEDINIFDKYLRQYLNVIEEYIDAEEEKAFSYVVSKYYENKFISNVCGL